MVEKAERRARQNPEQQNFLISVVESVGGRVPERELSREGLKDQERHRMLGVSKKQWREGGEKRQGKGTQ